MKHREVINGESAMLRFGERVANSIEPGSIIYLHGELGAGKTTLTKGIIAGLGCSDPVTSPTYTLVNQYSFGKNLVYHFDLYRIKAPDELEAIGIRDMLDGAAISIFEWPELGEGVLPEADIEIWIAVSEKGREVVVANPLVQDAPPVRQIADG
ncbi:MAG: tRNA (adenosine(37)-N6)-threonylcarbamoyltransferase complex ATPase subunit type 1 TsaE [bacterium]